LFIDDSHQSISIGRRGASVPHFDPHWQPVFKKSEQGNDKLARFFSLYFNEHGILMGRFRASVVDYA
jgi:hypothetical protein